MLASCPVKKSSQRASVTIVELRAKPPDRVLIFPSSMLAFKQHGLWEHHTLEWIRLAELHNEFLFTVQQQPRPRAHIQPTGGATVPLWQNGWWDVLVQ